MVLHETNPASGPPPAAADPALHAPAQHGLVPCAGHVHGLPGRICWQDVKAQPAVGQEPPHVHRLPPRGCVQRRADVVREQAVGACGHAPHEGPQAVTCLFLLLCVRPREGEGRSVDECLSTQACKYQQHCAGDASKPILYTRSSPPERSDYTPRPAWRASRRPGAGATGRRLSGSASPLA